jgi:predicted aspartyl protease
VIEGQVTEERVPIIRIPIGGQVWPAVIDTGFNGFLELPENLRTGVNAKFIGLVQSTLAAGQVIMEANYEVEFPFDGKQIQAEATFASGDEILIGTALLGEHRLEIDFIGKDVLLKRVTDAD